MKVIHDVYNGRQYLFLTTIAAAEEAELLNDLHACPSIVEVRGPIVSNDNRIAVVLLDSQADCVRIKLKWG